MMDDHCVIVLLSAVVVVRFGYVKLVIISTHQLGSLLVKENIRQLQKILTSFKYAYALM